MEYSAEELAQSKRQIDSVLHKTRQAVVTLEAKGDPQRYKSQISLAKRRIKALELAAELIQREIEKK